MVKFGKGVLLMFGQLVYKWLFSPIFILCFLKWDNKDSPRFVCLFLNYKEFNWAITELSLTITSHPDRVSRSSSTALFFLSYAMMSTCYRCCDNQDLQQLTCLSLALFIQYWKTTTFPCMLCDMRKTIKAKINQHVNQEEIPLGEDNLACSWSGYFRRGQTAAERLERKKKGEITAVLWGCLNSQLD